MRKSHKPLKVEPAVKDDSGKLRYDLVPAYAFSQVVRVYTVGAVKYADRNWEKGMSWGRIFAAMMRHSWSFWMGETHDKEDGIHHMAHAAWCALALVEFTKTQPKFDDRPKSI